ncbi:MAG: SMI1/KNR4 family protein [Helicobacteraceae bacterium]|jgi:hypothetical protein|nr:SMI1/KNR4 family protein [Helicobacteraceae bacterium]
MINENIQRIKLKIQEKGIITNKPISINKITKFENNYKFILPEELVLFYTETGNGCEIIDGFYLKGLEELEFDENRAKEDFVFSKYWIWEDDETNNLFDKVGSGNIELIDIGDSQSWNIIITGEERGQMWFFTDVGIQPCAPKRSFLSWFEYWLDGNGNYFEEFES